MPAWSRKMSSGTSPARRAEAEIQPRLQLRQEALRRPILLHKEILHAGPVAALTQRLLIAEDLRNGLSHARRLFGPHECIQAHGQMRLVRKPAAHAQRKAATPRARTAVKADVVDLRI